MLFRTTTFLITFVVVLSIAGCGSTLVHESANQNSRVSIIVIHHTAIDFDKSLRTLTEPSSRPVSAHYLIPEPDDRSYPRSKLKVLKLVDEDRRAWHAGTSYWAGKSGLNDQSIGIELVNTSWCHASATQLDANTGAPKRFCFFPDFPDGQIALLVGLLEEILERHPDIRPTHIVGHSDIAPDRKVDPGPRFPWQRLARLGYGAWYDNATVLKYWERFLNDPLPLVNIQRALAAYGYNIEVTGEPDEQTRNVVRAFQLHFRPEEVTREVSVETAAILFALIEKYYPEQLEELLLVDAPVVPDEALPIPPADPSIETTS